MDVSFRMLSWQQSFFYIFWLHLYAQFYLIVTNNSLIVAHINIQPICAHTFDVIIFADFAVFFHDWLTTLNLHISGTKKDIDK